MHLEKAVKSKIILPIAVLVFLVGGAAVVLLTSSGAGKSSAHIVGVSVPTLSAKAKVGSKVFGENCVQCHGENAAGSEQGPPLIHKFYEPNHHADGAFYLAAQRGVRAHHWRFGDMPPQPHISQLKMSAIVQYVREIQKHNGIF